MGTMKHGLSFGARSKWAVTGAYRRDLAQARAPRHPGSRHVAWAGLPGLAQRLCRSPLASVHPQASPQAAMPVAAGSATAIPGLPLCLAASGAQDQNPFGRAPPPPPLAALHRRFAAHRPKKEPEDLAPTSRSVRGMRSHAHPNRNTRPALAKATRSGKWHPRPGSSSRRKAGAIALERSPNSTLREPIDGSLQGGASASGHETGLWLYPGPIPGTVQEHAPGSPHLRPGELAPGEVAVVEIGVGDGVVRPVDGNRLERHLPWNLHYWVRPLQRPRPGFDRTPGRQ